MKLVAARCPNCGANIDVDKDSDSTRCEYCKSKIIVEDAIQKVKVEMSGSVEVTNSTSVSKLLKIANQYYFDKEYKDALKYYEKALELNPDEPLVVLRVGLCDALSNYNSVDINKPIKALKNAYRLLSDDKEKNKKIINSYINESSDVVKLISRRINGMVYNSLGETQALLIKNRNVLGFYEYCYSIVVEDDSILDDLYFKIKNIISVMLSLKYYYGGRYYNYQMNQTYRNNLIETNNKYLAEYQNRHPGLEVKNDVAKYKYNAPDTNKSSVAGIGFCAFMILGSIINSTYGSILPFLIALVLFINPLFKNLVRQYPFVKYLIIVGRVLFIFIGIMIISVSYS